MSISEYVSSQLLKTQERIKLAAISANRDPMSVTLVGAAKEMHADLVAAFHQIGLNHIGENYLNQAIEKQASLKEKRIVWHFIGRIQSNKTSEIASHFSWVHGIDRIKIARRFDDHSKSQANLDVMVQINIDDEPKKSGVEAKVAAEFCDELSQLENLNLRGFMVLPKARTLFDQQRKPFALTRELLETTNQRYGLSMDTLSMGMSNDLEAAITEGSTMVRIGTDLFGPRGN